MKKGLVIKNEWIDQIFDDGKTFEMRSRPTKIRGKIELIESGSGLIVGEAQLIECFKIKHDDKSLVSYHKVRDTELLKKWCWAWVLKGAKRYVDPVPYDHPQGAVIWVNL